ncbi:hypothetical protein OsJ_18055 [Oryza sativa Japonica Group]|uniref:DUF4283 domain-containing protein n=1 Tax=Oryza sativa subsp. japonica TaxID=39947 RepID=B9FGN4_ORYSJ|nr:hypothetical protein OsJ_18055 [Oryza sativa Japonica Group]
MGGGVALVSMLVRAEVGFNGSGFQHSLGFAARPDGGGVGAGNLVFGAVPGMSAPVFPAAGGGVLPAGALLTGVAPGGGLQMAGGGVLTGVLPAGAVPTSGAPGGRLQMAAGGLQSGALLTGGVPGGGLQAGFPTNECYSWCRDRLKVDGGGIQTRGSGAMVSNISSGPTAGGPAGGSVPSGGAFGAFALAPSASVCGGGKESQVHGEPVQHEMAACLVDVGKGKSKVESKGSAGHKIKHEPRAALIKVSKGKLSVNDVIVELERLIPGRWRWVVHDNGDDTFRTMFPSAAELRRMVEWGKVHTKVGEAEMEIVERGVGNEVKYVIPKVWVQCKGLPSELREYLIIWAVGSILSITKAVDMLFTRRYDIARLQVLALDPSLIPDVVDVVIGDHLYELAFKVEPESGADEPVPMEMENVDDGNLEEKDDGNMKQVLGKEVGGDSGNNSMMGSGGQSSGVGGSSVPSAQLSLLPEYDGLTTSDEEFDGLEEEPVVVEKLRTQESLGAKLAAIPEAVISPSRKSKRRASDSDQIVLERAEKLKTEKNLVNMQAKDDVINDLKSIEEKRLGNFVCSSVNQATTSIVESELLDDHLDDNTLLQHLCGDIMEEVMDLSGVDDNYSHATLNFLVPSPNTKKSAKKGKKKKSIKQ